LHFALRKVLGTHVEQKGSLVNSERLRFDFLHMQKMSAEEIEQAENLVNEMINMGSALDEKRSLPIDEARKMGAMALFSEKYDDHVRVVKFGESIELCGGTHVDNTARIGLIKIVSESAIAAGIRRIEAITGKQALEYYKEQEKQLTTVKELFNNSKDIIKSIENHFAEFDKISKQLAQYEKEKAGSMVDDLVKSAKNINGINTIFSKIEISDGALLRDISFQIKAKVENLYMVLAAELNGKANLAVTVSENLVKEKNLHAGNIVKEIAKEINGGGGGQPFYATAGGTKLEGIENALTKASALL
jgi:alanyl-tRNA synthetase